MRHSALGFVLEDLSYIWLVAEFPVYISMDIKCVFSRIKCACGTQQVSRQAAHTVLIWSFIASNHDIVSSTMRKYTCNQFESAVYEYLPHIPHNTLSFLRKIAVRWLAINLQCTPTSPPKKMSLGKPLQRQNKKNHTASAHIATVSCNLLALRVLVRPTVLSIPLMAYHRGDLWEHLPPQVCDHCMTPIVLMGIPWIFSPPLSLLEIRCCEMCCTADLLFLFCL